VRRHARDLGEAIELLGMDPVELVIFDCDGVLVDSEVISNEVLARALSSEGLQTSLAEARAAYQGLLLSEVVQRAEQALGRALPEGWLARYESDRAEAFRRELRPVAGAADAVRACIGVGLGVCVASQGKLEKTRLSLELTGLAPLFAPGALFSAEQVARGKPHPDLFLYAAHSMGATPGASVVVEDTPSGVRAAAAAGMRALGYAADADPGALAAAGAQLLWSLEELTGLLEAAGSR
jgi:beta-phosphoglucomutase-like phosphatase (HAD superfamily)